MNFLKTVNENTADKLRSAGFQELPKEGKFFVFINNGKLNFSDDKTIVYTDKLSI